MGKRTDSPDDRVLQFPEREIVEIDAFECFDKLVVFFAEFVQPGGEIIDPVRRPPSCLDKMVVNRARTHRGNRLSEPSRSFDCLNGVKNYRCRLHEYEFVSFGDGENVRQFADPLIDRVGDCFAEFFKRAELVRIEHAEPFGENPVAERPGRPDGEIVPELGIIETRSDERFREMVENASLRAGQEPFAEFPEVDGGGYAGHSGDQGAVFDFERHILCVGFGGHIFRVFLFAINELIGTTATIGRSSIFLCDASQSPGCLIIGPRRI